MVNIDGQRRQAAGGGQRMPFHPGSYLTPETDTYYGEALAVWKQAKRRGGGFHQRRERSDTRKSRLRKRNSLLLMQTAAVPVLEDCGCFLVQL